MSLINRNTNRVRRFEKQSKGMNNKEKRQLETQLLRPEPVPTYTGDLPENYGIDALTVSIVFPNNKIKALAEKFLKISFSKVKKQQYITDISMLIKLFELMDKGIIVYKNNAFFIHPPSFKKKKKRRRSL